MRFVRLGDAGAEIPAVEDGNIVYDLSPITPDIDGAFLAADGVAKVRDALSAGRLEQLPGAADLRIGAPVAKPGAVLCIGQNYAAHAAESGDAPPEVPILFFKHPNTVVGPYDQVRIPPGAEKVDWEVELAIVIGKRARYLSSPDDAPDYIAGYAVSNDVSERAYQVSSPGDSGPRGNAARHLTLSGRTWCRPTRFPTSKRCGCGRRSTESRARIRPPRT